mmetsp:Transcript_28891/g.37727  ORF Transcript_28891/g.37727 Transcript_28891/m.37727 type:complete len:99 (+) Transcript_28891:1419-1715(+)
MLLAFPALRPPPPPAAAPAPLAAARLCVACMKVSKWDRGKRKSETKKEFRRFYRVMSTREKCQQAKIVCTAVRDVEPSKMTVTTENYHSSVLMQMQSS